MSTFAGRDIISVRDITRDDITTILTHAAALKQTPQPDLLTGHVMGSCFFEPSTRTRLSFETAMERLGGRVTGFADANVTSTKKKETLYDTIKIIGQYVDVIAMRHPLDGAARRGAEATDKPVLNGGDGANQHPTQTLLDLFTINECQGKIDDLSIALVGDLKYGRTVHSLAQALAHFNVSLSFVAPQTLQMPTHICQELDAAGVTYQQTDELDAVIPHSDIVYMTRIQEERFADKLEYEQVKDAYVLDTDSLIDAKSTLRVLHPLPRVTEIDAAVDDTPHAYYFEQAQNGLYVRQALLGLILNVLT